MDFTKGREAPAQRPRHVRAGQGEDQRQPPARWDSLSSEKWVRLWGTECPFPLPLITHRASLCPGGCRLSLAMPFPSLPQLSLALMLTLGPIPALAGPVSTCDANGSLYYVGEWYFLDSDHCTQCECTPEGPACARTDCTALPPACIHVSHYPSDCCPRCERVGCEHRGQVYELGQHFQVRDPPHCFLVRGLD